MKDLSTLRTSVACLEFSGRVSGYASVVNWFLSSRQSPTVARIAPLLAVVGLYGCSHSSTSHWAGSNLSQLYFGKLREHKYRLRMQTYWTVHMYWKKKADKKIKKKRTGS